MSYVRDNGLARARRRRERRSLAVLIFSALLVLGSIVFALAFMGSSPKPATTSCPSSATTTPPTKKFVVNVYNAGGAKGSAGAAADALRSHNFSVGVVGNDPYKKTIKGAGEVRFGVQGRDAANKYVRQYAPGATLVEDGRDGTTIDVVVGPQFQSIKPAPETDASNNPCATS